MHPCVSLDVPGMSLRYLEHAALDRPSSKDSGEAADRSSPRPGRALPAPEIQSTDQPSPVVDSGRYGRARPHPPSGQLGAAASR